MKIHGADGLSAENIRDEVNRGGRLVIYQYCISVVFMTFKRPTEIRLIKAGHSPAQGGLLFVLISLVGGWWGIPWGPIYTIESIYRNLSGGIDVTDGVLRSLFPAGAGAAPAAAAAPSLRAAPAPARGRTNVKTIVLMIGAAAGLILGGISIYCLVQSRSLTVVLVSGLDRPYKVTLNGVTHQLAAQGSEVLTLPEGTFTLGDAEGGAIVGPEQSSTFAIPFFSHLDESHVAVINPDRPALLFSEIVTYTARDSATPAEPEEPAYTVLANQQFYFIDKPDFVLEPPTQSISMSAGTARLVKTRLEHIRNAGLPAVLHVLQEKSGYPAVRDQLMIQEKYHTDEAFIVAAVSALKPADFRAFFLPHLADRPVLVEWHRYYQNYIQRTEPDNELAREYRGYLQAAPNDGTLQYLLGRVTADRAAARQLYNQALAARPPCAYAQAALGFDAMSGGSFAEALADYDAAERAGVHSQAITHYRQEIYWGLRQFDRLIGELRAARAAKPLDLALAAEEISAVLAAGQDVTAARKISTDALAAFKTAKADSKTLAESSDFLLAGIAYQTGHLADYAERVSRLGGPFYEFRAALTRGELEPAAKAALAVPYPRPVERLLLYLLAKQQGNEAAAGKYFAQAQELMGKDAELKSIAALLASPQRPAPEALTDFTADLTERCVFFTALGVWDHEHQKTYQAMAAKLDVRPDFPHLFLSSFLKPDAPSSL